MSQDMTCVMATGRGFEYVGKIQAEDALGRFRAHLEREIASAQKALAELDAGEVRVSWRRGYRELDPPAAKVV